MTYGTTEEIATSFPGSSLFLSRGRKREDPGDEVEEIERVHMTSQQPC